MCTKQYRDYDTTSLVALVAMSFNVSVETVLKAYGCTEQQIYAYLFDNYTPEGIRQFTIDVLCGKIPITLNEHEAVLIC